MIKDSDNFLVIVIILSIDRRIQEKNSKINGSVDRILEGLTEISSGGNEKRSNVKKQLKCRQTPRREQAKEETHQAAQRAGGRPARSLREHQRSGAGPCSWWWCPGFASGFQGVFCRLLTRPAVEGRGRASG